MDKHRTTAEEVEALHGSKIIAILGLQPRLDKMAIHSTLDILTGDLTGKDGRKLSRTINNTLFAKSGILLLKHTLTFLPVGIDINTGTAHLLDETVTQGVRVTLIEHGNLTDEADGVIPRSEAHHRASVTLGLLSIVSLGNLLGIISTQTEAYLTVNIPEHTILKEMEILLLTLLLDTVNDKSTAKLLLVHIQHICQLSNTAIIIVGTLQENITLTVGKLHAFLQGADSAAMLGGKLPITLWTLTAQQVIARFKVANNLTHQ